VALAALAALVALVALVARDSLERSAVLELAA